MLSESEILNIVKLELESSSNPLTDSTHEKALDYYLGNPRGDEVEGRSQIISTDVADSIEWMMPQIMESFTSNNEVVTFDPTGPGDEKQAALESEYVYSLLMRQNDGYIILHQFIKDALLQNNGIIKAWYSVEDKKEAAQYTGILEPQLQMLASQSDVEITSLSEEPVSTPMGDMMQYNVGVVRTYPCKKINIECVPPEQFRLSNKHNSISLKDARFTAHIMTKTISDLIAEGFDADILKNLESEDNLRSDYRFSAQNEQTDDSNADTPDKSMRLVEIAECYMPMDRDGDGIAEMSKITVALNGESPTKILLVEDIDENPWVGTTGILMSHKFKGLSIYDRIKSLQDQKTALIRNILDNIYYINNQEYAVLEGRVDIDDFLESAPGRLKRVQDMNAFMPLPKAQIGADAYNLLEYLDQIRAGRTGVSAEGSSAPQNIGNQIGSQGVERLMSAKEALVGLIIRTIAETGIKPLCIKLRDLAIKHMDTVEDFQFRGQWTQVLPKQWPPRSTCSVRVGAGTGDRNRQLVAINTIMQLQQQLAANPQTQVLIDLSTGYNAIDDYCKFSGLLGAERYFIDPNSPAGQAAQQAAAQSQAQQAQEQKQLQQAQLQMEAQLSQSAVQTAQAQLQSVQARFESDRVKADLQGRIKELEAQIKHMQHSVDTEFKYDELASKTALELMKLQQPPAQFAVDQGYIEDNLQ